MNSEEMLALAESVASGKSLDNALDVLIEVALFEPSKGWAGVRANDAGTKVIYSDMNGAQRTYWAEEWTADRAGAAELLRARAQPPEQLKGEGR